MQESSNRPRGLRNRRSPRRPSHSNPQPPSPKVGPRTPAPTFHSEEQQRRPFSDRFDRRLDGPGVSRMQSPWEPDRVNPVQAERSIPGQPVGKGTGRSAKIAHLPPAQARRKQPQPNKPAARRRAAADGGVQSRKVRPLRPPTNLAAHPTLRSQQQGQRRPQRSTPPLVYIVRLLILGIGVGAIAGTIISVWNPGLRHADANDPNATSQANVANAQSLNKDGGTASPASLTTASLKTGRELTQLGSRIAPLTQGLTDLVPGVFLMEVDSGDFYSLNGTSTFSAASMIKIPILIAFFQDVDAGKIRLDEIMTLQQEDLADGSGDMQYSGVGTKYSALDTVTNMIIYSDNTATNMLIRRLGGIQVLNQRFQQWGLKQTAIRHLLPDLDGTNTTSPKELVTLLAMLGQGELISMKSRDRALDIMRHTVTDTLLPAAMGEGATIAHKTGDIGSLVGDSGIIDMPNGKRYIISAMVKRPNNDSRAQELIRHIARTVYDYLYDPNAVPSAASSPSPSLLAPTGNGAPAANPAGTAPPPANANAPSTTQTTDNPPPAVDRGNAAGAATDTGTAEPTASPEDNASTGSEPQATDNGSNGTGNETVDAAQSPEAEPSTSDEQDTANSNPSGSNTTPPAF